MKNTTESLLEVKGLRTSFHTIDGIARAVDGIDFEVFPGETVGLVGESGCGKSVTSMSIMRLLRTPPAEIEGTARFKGRNLFDLEPEDIRKIRGKEIAMIFQEPMTSLNPVITVGEQIAEAIRLHLSLAKSVSWKRVIDMLRTVRISSPKKRAGEYPHKLSGGMRQRVMIAMALSCNAELIFADEPTTALDVTIQAQIMELMVELKNKFNTSIVLITHDLGVIAEMADRILVMYAGKIIEEAPVRELFKDPRHPYTRGLLASIPVIGGKKKNNRFLQEIPGFVPSLLDMPFGCRFHPRCNQAMNICRQEEPQMVTLGANRRVMCWLEQNNENSQS